MKILLDDHVPSDLTDAQKKSTVCEWFVREYLKFAECFIRSELNHAPQDLKITIEKPIDFRGELIDFADILIEYETPKKLHERDKWINKTLSLKKSMSLNDMLEKSILNVHPTTSEAYDKKKTKSLFSVDYNAPYLLENELEKIGETRKRLIKEYKSAVIKSVSNLEDFKYTDLRKECLLISVLPTLEGLKTDINEAIRKIKAQDFYLEDITQKFIVYWGRTDDDVKEYLQHENIELVGLYETLYYIDEDLKDPEDQI